MARKRIKPMLAKLTDKPFNRDGWLFEIKWDGYRAIADVNKGKVELYSRRGLNFTKYKPVLDALKKLKVNAVFDGEIVALKDGKPDFHTLQQYEENHAQLKYVIFDLLEWKGKDLRPEPLLKRKEILKKNFPKDPTFIYSDHVEEKGLKFFEQVKKQKLEGMLAKDGTSAYIEGSRSSSWLKVKHFNVQEAIIVGYTKPRGSRKLLGALVLATHKDGGLKYIGHSGGGFTQSEIKDLYEKLSKIKVDKSPLDEKVPINSPITWVKPKYVCQIEFSEWTPDGRMRHPIYAGLREDKKPSEVLLEKSVSTNPTALPSLRGLRHRSDVVDTDLNLTNLDKVFWPEEGYTKGDLVEYYDKIAPIILPYLIGRPESLHRHPNGWEGKSFFQKDIKNKVPEFVRTEEIWSESNNADIRYLLCENKETLLYLANLGCIELNPWNSRIENLDNPDYMVIDLDPAKRPFKELVKVAQEANKLLTEACEAHYIKTSGKKGLHIFIPLGAKYDYDTVRTFSELLVRILHKRLPDLTSIERTPSKRGGKIYLDYLQNRRGQTIAAPYSVRPWKGATVSTPLRWEEVNSKLDPSKFTIKTIWKRLEKHGDLWERILEKKVDLEKSIKCLEEKIDTVG
jgi:bifunctional non-homologous end joining protein LigD